mmetsp:Transcript_81870/g.187353  ORF Transcript_81870/g.187353 Transcript_81870/m.187353 type:complete len:238 (-) Transcript_81870:1092-1805(-)
MDRRHHCKGDGVSGQVSNAVLQITHTADQLLVILQILQIGMPLLPRLVRRVEGLRDGDPLLHRVTVSGDVGSDVLVVGEPPGIAEDHRFLIPHGSHLHAAVAPIADIQIVPLVRGQQRGGDCVGPPDLIHNVWLQQVIRQEKIIHRHRPIPVLSQHTLHREGPSVNVVDVLRAHVGPALSLEGGGEGIDIPGSHRQLPHVHVVPLLCPVSDKIRIPAGHPLALGDIQGADVKDVQGV